MGGFWGNEVGLHQADWVVTVYHSCLDEPHADVKACDENFQKFWPEAIQHYWEYVAIYALVIKPEDRE